MKYSNKPMKEWIELNEQEIAKNEIDSGLLDFFEKGFGKQGEGIFFDKIFSDELKEEYFVKDEYSQYTDLSGFENTMNRFHVDDYIDNPENCFMQAFVFLKYFKRFWQTTYPDTSCIIIIGFQNDEVCKSSTFTFYVHRENETIYDIDNIDEYLNPIYIEFLNTN